MEYQIFLQKTSGKKIYVDPQIEEGLYLYPGEVKKSGIKDGMILTEEEWNSLRYDYAIPRAKKRALGLLSKKDMTQAQLVEKLEKSFHDPVSISEAMSFVIDHGYVDDEAYARDYIYFRKGRKSFRQMKEELLRKGISREILDHVFEEEGEQPLEDLEPLVYKYSRRFEEIDYTATQKICMHFARKGYRVESVREIIEDIKTKRMQ